VGGGGGGFGGAPRGGVCFAAARGPVGGGGVRGVLGGSFFVGLDLRGVGGYPGARAGVLGGWGSSGGWKKRGGVGGWGVCFWGGGAGVLLGARWFGLGFGGGGGGGGWGGVGGAVGGGGQNVAGPLLPSRQKFLNAPF